MTDMRAGATHLILPTLGKPEERKGKFLDAVRKAAAGEFEILGELGRRADGGIAYLARDLTQSRLVALRFELTPGSHHDYVLEVLKELDSSLPASGLGCPGCGNSLRGWGRYCPGCGYDLSGSSGSTPPLGRSDPLQAVKELVGDGFQVLGRMRRAEGGGMIYFAREQGRDTIVGFRMKRESGQEPAVDRTAVIPSLADDSDDGSGLESVPDFPELVGQGPPPESSYGGEPKAAVGKGVVTDQGGRATGRRSAVEPKPVKAPSQFSWTWAAFIIVGTLVVGLVLGALLT